MYSLLSRKKAAIVAYAEGKPAEVAFVLPAAFMRDAEGNIGTVETDLVEENGKIRLFWIAMKISSKMRCTRLSSIR